MEIKYGVVAVRVSTDKQGLMGDSPEDQKKQIEKKVQQLSSLLGYKIKIKKWFEFVESASGEMDMQPLQKAIEYCKDPKNKISFFFVRSLDRFTHGGSTIYGLLKLQLSRCGVQLLDVYGVIGSQKINTLEHLDVEYDWSKFSPTYINEILTAERAKDEVRDILTRMIGAEISYVRFGYGVRGAQMGYQNEKIDTPHGSRVIRKPHPIESTWIIRMFEFRVEGKTDDEAVNEINEMGFKTRTYKIHDLNDKRKIIGCGGGIPLTVKQFQRYIENPIYAGINDEKWTNGKPVVCQFKGLVTPEIFNRANQGKVVILNEGGQIKVVRNKTPWAVKRYKDNPDYPFRHYVICDYCGKDLKGSAPRSKSGKHSPRYHCGGKKRGHKFWSVNSKEFNNTIAKFVSDIRFSKTFKDKFRKTVIEQWDSREKKASNDSINYSQLVVQKEFELQGLKEKLKILSSQTAIKMIEEDIEKAERERAQLVVKRDKTEEQGIDVQIAINYCLYYMEHLDKLILSGTNPQRNAKLFSLLFEEKPTYQELVNGTPNLSPIIELNNAFETSEKQFVSHKDFSWNQYLLELKQLYSIIPEPKQHILVYPTNGY